MQYTNAKCKTTCLDSSSKLKKKFFDHFLYVKIFGHVNRFGHFWKTFLARIEIWAPKKIWASKKIWARKKYLARGHVRHVGTSTCTKH